MKCPNCNQKTIKFGSWCRSPNAFRWRCPHCNAMLKAGPSTWRWFLIVVTLTLGIVATVFYLQQIALIPQGYARPLIFLGVLSLLPAIYLAFRKGDYVLRWRTDTDET